LRLRRTSVAGGSFAPDRPPGVGDRRRWPRSIGLILGVALFVATAGSASAGTVVPFNPAQPTVFVAQGGPTQLDQAQQSGGAIVFTPVGGVISGLTYNAIGYDTCNNFIYGVQTSTANGGVSGDIIQIASDGTISYTGIDVGSPFNVGGFGPDSNCDDFYVGESGGSTLDIVNVNNSTFTSSSGRCRARTRSSGSM
jgi:hypothetical protein